MKKSHEFIPDGKHFTVTLKPGKAKEQMLEIADFLLKSHEIIEFHIDKEEIPFFELATSINAFTKRMGKNLKNCA